MSIKTNTAPPALAMRIAAFQFTLSRKVFIGDPDPRNMRARVRRLIAKEIDALKAQYTLATVKGYLTFYRSALIDTGLGSHTDLLRLSDEDYAQLKVEYLQQINEDQSHLRPLDPDTVIQTARSLLSAPRYIQVTAGLMLLTGRRVIEVLKTGVFEYAGTEGTIHFSGQAKTRNAEGTRTESYQIPILASADTILESWHRLREEKGEDFAQKPNNKVTTGVSKMLTETVRKAFGRDFKPKDLRSAYAQICYHRFCPSYKSDTVYFSEILGHKLIGDESTDLMTAQSYRDFYIAEATDTYAEGDIVRENATGTRYYILDASHADLITVQRSTLDARPDTRAKKLTMARSLFSPVEIG
jgi:integrase